MRDYTNIGQHQGSTAEKRYSAPPRLAGFWVRAAAYALDYLIILPLILFVCFFALGVFVGMTGGPSDPDSFFNGNYNLLTLGVVFMYYTILQASPLQGTFGKAAVGIKIINSHNERISILRSAWRTLFYLPSAVLLCLGFFMIGLREDKRGLHDLFSGTYVVYKR